ncbi:hypothetical protein LOZ39_002405 [Ophidiomyces ophidiicola]|nr:hypothetical protein LOZ61_003195 [Ophidiomyces ophidiicola]KAI1918309.1 hypothetical protein LOZ64_002883 [Ophidiomyces ophidiicola]KAI1922126.1 hypothetical protein LOZ60_005845 [Ophidiomyces ophidiicola]KAI1959196.1 hypothetical protein LOZ59_003116 [Ophidiomyces ophidiicola]KAI2014821.1 hypothetical protein LOZ49_001048 [Ophidiomyces ophidiicola]
MTDTCIVCLGDLGESASDPTLAADTLPRPTTDSRPADEVTATRSQESDQIAHLIPCGHHLHNECLKPWVERANSCPICRQNFNTVELLENLGGAIISSYSVEDRVQVAELDPSLLVEDLVDDTDSQPCPICGDDDNEDLLLLCDGCDTASHTYCVGLDSVPTGRWFCCHCEGRQRPRSEHSRPQNRTVYRTRGEIRRARTRNHIQALHWARVWQSVWDHLNLDLDFPFDDEEAVNRVIQRRRTAAANRREVRSWQRRFRQTERRTAVSRASNYPSDLLDIGRGWPSRPRQRVETPEPESFDEIRAWNAFERAREIQEAPGPSRRKRKSPTASPVESEQPQVERRLKRPRTRRAEELAELADRGESSRASRSAVSASSPPADTGPTFLQSLLKEVEDSSGPHRIGAAFLSSSRTRSDPASPGASSPALSPVSSSRSSPRPVSNPAAYATSSSDPSTPLSTGSDLGISSPEFSPACSPSQHGISVNSSRSSRELRRLENGSSRQCSAESSPSRADLSHHIKSDLQKIVRAALRPYYHQKLISKEDYTETNKCISRMLYDLAASQQSGDPMDAECMARWAGFANTEVMKAVRHIQDTKSNEASDSSGAASS